MMSLKKQLDEADLKIRCIDFILEQKSSEDMIVINEFAYADGARRADLVRLDEGIHAYEIKSDLDSLKRLDFQLMEYRACFDFVNIVTTEKHLSGVRNKTPRYVGIILVKENNITQVRKPQRFKKFNKYLLTTLVDSVQVNQILREIEVSVRNDLSAVDRRKLLVQSCNVTLLHNKVLSHLHAKYQSRYMQFIKNRGNVTLLDDLLLLGNLRLW
ncbi:sce7726 family protein [Ochrobactrum sp. GRS2]|nr:sce7726 family protein [Ochrobactrum sp. GRS2]